MMIVVVIILVLLCSEIFFLIYNVKRREKSFGLKALIRLFTALLICIAMITGLLEGIYRYIFITLILFFQAAAGFISFHRKKFRKVNLFKAIFCLLINISAYIFFMIPSMIFPQYKMPEITGKYTVSEKTYTWTDDKRNEIVKNTDKKRSVTVKVWYPKEEGSFPLILYSHGSGSTADANKSTCINLSSNGYIVAAVSYNYDSAYVIQENRKIILESPEISDSANQISQPYDYIKKMKNIIDIRCDDMNFVIDKMLEKPQPYQKDVLCKIDKNHIGLFGHSLGGATVAELGRRRNDICAVVNLEGENIGEYIIDKNNNICNNDNPYQIPYLDMITEQTYKEKTSRKYNKLLNNSGYNEDINIFTVKNGKEAAGHILINGGHLNFTDIPLINPITCRYPRIPENTVVTGKEARNFIGEVNKEILNFFNYELKNDQSYKMISQY